ncbi:PorV/PorQ family protein [Candidatus Fermentibacteria bacterium]|nr:PorV/PorQ family protein [Candidatus Fermentibacteria bacterium]
MKNVDHRRRIVLKKAVLILAMAAAARAGSGVYRDAGSAAFQFLKLETSARASALGGTSLMNSGSMSILSSPSALASLGGAGISFCHAAHFGSTTQNSMAFHTRAGRASVAFGATSVYTGGMELRDGASSEPLGEFSCWDIGLAAGAGMDLGPFDAGVAARLIREKIWTSGTWGFSFDAGVSALPAEWLRISAAFLNIGPEADFEDGSFRLPATWRAGASANAELPLAGASTLTGEVWKSIDGRPQAGVGLETVPAGWAALRAGFRAGSDAVSATAGAGLTAAGWTLDYAWLPSGSPIGDIHRISLSRSL